MYCDIFPVGGIAQISHQFLVTDGFKADADAMRPHLVPEIHSPIISQGIIFKADFAPTKLIANQPAVLRYVLTDEAVGTPISDLEPFLGAWGHTLIVSEDATNYLHCHPSVTAEKNLKNPAVIYFETSCPKAGNYRVWSQFLRKGKIVTVSFDVKVVAAT